MRSRTAGSPIGTDSSNDDNIHVASVPQLSVDNSDEEGDPLSDLERLDRTVQDGSSFSAYMGKTNAATRAYMQDVQMMDAGDAHEDDDDVSEYSFTSEDYVHDSEMENSNDEDARSHISLSDDEPEVPPIGDIEWATLNEAQRVHYERMFGIIPPPPINGSYGFSETYQLDIDSQCCSYLSVFTVDKWLLSPQEIKDCVDRLAERMRMRKINIPIFNRNLASQQQNGSHHQSQPFHAPGQPVPDHQTLRSQPLMQPMAVPSGARLGHQTSQNMAFPQQHQQRHIPNGGLPMGMYSTQSMPMQAYQMQGQMPQQAFHGMAPNMGARQILAAKPARKLKINVGDSNGRGFRSPMMMAPPPLKAPTPPYLARERPELRKTVGKSGRGKTRRQAEADEFPWNRELDFVAARDALKTKDTWDYSVYDTDMLATMARTRLRNEPVVAALEKEITRKQKDSRKIRKPSKDAPKPEASSDDEGERDAEGEGEAEDEAEDGSRRAKGGRKKSRPAGESGNDPYHSGNFAFAGLEDAALATKMGMHTVDEVIAAGEADNLSLDQLFRVKICWSPGKKGNSQDLEQAKFSVKDTVLTRKMLKQTPILSHRAGECIIDFCPDLLWRDILLRILSEAGFSNKDIRDRFCLNGSFSDRATVAKRLGAALGKDTNPPRGKGKEAALDWCETNRDDFDNYQAFFGKRPPARRTAQGRKKSRLSNAKPGESGEEASPSKDGEKDGGQKVTLKMAMDGAADEESAGEESDDDDDQDDDAVSLQDSDDLDAMSD